eukprot:6980968-Pyramimonas_sp.AAC.1
MVGDEREGKNVRYDASAPSLLDPLPCIWTGRQTTDWSVQEGLGENANNLDVSKVSLMLASWRVNPDGEPPLLRSNSFKMAPRWPPRLRRVP